MCTTSCESAARARPGYPPVLWEASTSTLCCSVSRPGPQAPVVSGLWQPATRCGSCRSTTHFGTTGPIHVPIMWISTSQVLRSDGAPKRFVTISLPRRIGARAASLAFDNARSPNFACWWRNQAGQPLSQRFWFTFNKGGCMPWKYASSGLVLVAALLAGCSSTPESSTPAESAAATDTDQSRCDAAAAQFAVGKPASPALLEQARVKSGAQTARVLGPNDMVTL